MVSFLHTADWQLGGTFQGVDPDKTEKLRKARLQTVRNLLELAKKEEVDFVVSAGDNFESNQVDRGLMRKTREILNDFPGLRIYLIPGNHDPLMEDYASRREVFNSLGDHVRFLEEEEPVEVSGTSVVIYPGICRRPKSSRNPLEWIPPRENSDRIRIGLAHGSWKVLPDLPEDDYPIEEDSATAKELDYLALGHWHSTFPDPRESRGRTYYSGTPEPTGFDESDSGNVLLVEVDSPGADPEVEKRRVSEYSWLDEKESPSDEVSVESLGEKLLSEPNPKQKLLRLRLEGTVPLEVRDRIERLVGELAEEFYFLRIEDEKLISAPSEEEARKLSSGTGWLKDAVDYLERLSSGETSAPPENWTLDEPPGEEEARRALELIYARIKEEGG